MTKAGRTARAIARQWFKEQSDLPIRANLKTHKHDPDIGGRLFTVDYFARSLDKIIHLYELYVLDDGTIQISVDNRNLPSEGGLINETRFFEVLSIKTEGTPKWFKRVQRASRFFDKRGIDGFAFVTYIPGERRLRIPIQIKSNFKAIKGYEAAHPYCAAHGVMVVIVNPAKSDDQIRTSVYNQLGAVRRRKMADRTRFTELHTILGGPRPN